MLDKDLIKGFCASCLATNFDNAVVIPRFHEELWELCCSDNKRIAIAAPRSHAKAQALTSRVLTPTGFTTIGELSVGDVIIGGDGKPAKVTQLHPVSEMELYRVETRDGKSALCNLDHLWNVECPSNQKGVQTKALRDILVNWKSERNDGITEYRYRIPAIPAIEFETKNFLIDPYTLGAWLGDGHSAGGRFTSADPEILSYFPYKTKKYATVYLYGIEDFTHRLTKEGLKNNKHIPEKYLYGSIEQRLSLLQGLMDTDGTCHQDGKIAYFCNTNYRLVTDVVSLIRSLGGIATTNTNRTKYNGKEFISWRVSCKLPKDMNPFRLCRKAEKWKGSVSTHSYITNIQKETVALGRCISVERQTYVTDNYLLTHNSTSITLTYLLAALLFRDRSYAVIVSNTEGQAIQFLNDIKQELLENDNIKPLFGVKGFLKDRETDVIVQMDDGHEFRIQAKGAEQKLRGLKWRNKRPDLFICDDFEEDESVMNQDRREKFRSWFFKALIPALSDNGKIIVVGTILHMDSLLERLLNDHTWATKRYRAHNEDFSEILWPERFSQERLEDIRASYITQGMPEGYSQEYLNYPIDESSAYFRRDDFRYYEPEDLDGVPLHYYCAIDFAISEKERADYTVIVTVGVDSNNTLFVIDVNRGRWDAKEIIDQMFATHVKYRPELFVAEEGMIRKSLGPFLKERMLQDNVFINLQTEQPVKDKQTRARSIQARIRTGSVYFNREADWYADFEQELIRFPRDVHDDQVDALAWIGLTLDKVNVAPTKVEYEDELWQDEWEEFEEPLGMSRICGY